jgi:hypothetical protein
MGAVPASRGRTPGSYQALDFADPLNPGDYIDVFGSNYYNNSVFSDVTSDYETGSLQYPGVGAGYFLPYSETGATVATLSGPVPVNITVQAPDSSFTAELLIYASGILAVGRRISQV